MAHQEIPDRQTAQAAAWLSEQLGEHKLDTPTFWLVAALLAKYRTEFYSLQSPRPNEALEALNKAFVALYLEVDARVVDDLRQRFNDYLVQQLRLWAKESTREFVYELLWAIDILDIYDEALVTVFKEPRERVYSATHVGRKAAVRRLLARFK